MMCFRLVPRIVLSLSFLFILAFWHSPVEIASRSQIVAFEVTAITFKAETQKSKGRCPVTMSFAGTITVNGKGSVNYTFLASDGTAGEVQTLSFNAAGSMPVTTHLTFTGPDLTKSTGWLAIKINSPNELESEKAQFAVDCGRFDSRGEPFLSIRDQYYVLPRAYPGKKIDDEARVEAFTKLNIKRNSLQIPHVNAEYEESPQTPGQRGRNGCAWYSAGPTNINGRITGIAIDPNSPQNIFVTSVGGIWRSKDGGRRWQRVSDEFLATVFASVAVNPANGSDVIAGAGEPNYHDPSKSGIGIWRSTAGGDPKSWIKVSPPELDGKVIYKLIVDPAAPNDIYAATSAGVYLGRRGPNDSINWERLDNFDGFTTDLAVDFTTSPRRIYAGVAPRSLSRMPGVWKYDGMTWQQRSSGIDTARVGVIALAISSSDPNILYAKVENSLTGGLLGVYKTTNGAEPTTGNSWTQLASASLLDDSCAKDFCYSWYNSVIAVDPSDAGVVYSGGMNLYRTTDGGQKWFNISDGNDLMFSSSLHPDQHVVAFDPRNSRSVFVGDDGGLFRGSDTSAATWHWDKISHGIVITEFYRITSQQLTATMLAGGSQDNGTEITFGNRTWYNPGGCDGADVTVDGKNSDTLYANCNGSLYELANPVPQTVGGGNQIEWIAPANMIIAPPLVTDESIPGAALATGISTLSPNGPRSLLRTVNGTEWDTVVSALPPAAQISFIAIAPSSSFQSYYLGVGVPDGSMNPAIWRTSDGGLTLDKSSDGLPTNLWPTGAAVDYSNPSRAVATFGGEAGGGVFLTINGGAKLNDLLLNEPGILRKTPVTGVGIDPSDPNVVYVSTRLGVFRGQIASNPAITASWTPFDEGLPNGLDVNTIWVNRMAGILSIGTMGHGVFQRDIRPGVKCAGAMLLVRDNIFDNGRTPSPQSIPDPEHPIADSARPGFYRPNDTIGGQVYWWTSPDIRFDVPSLDTPANRIAAPDHLEFETCPIEVGDCPAGTLLDSAPQPGQAAKVYVQVSNRGIQSASNVRVLALWSNAANLSFPRLPADFWSKTFPPGNSPCGPLDNSAGWNLIDPKEPCQIIPVINPELPEVVGFSWNVPTYVKSPCILIIVESADDPIDQSVRSTNETRIWMLVPNIRQMAMRNLQTIFTHSRSRYRRGVNYL